MSDYLLRQSTAGQEMLLGPFLDDTDGKTQETALTIANTDIKIFKAGATSEASKNSGGATHVASGRYYCVLDATDTDTLGSGELNVHVTGALPIKVRFTVLSAVVYDSLVAASDKLQVDVQEFGGSAGTFASGKPEVNLSTTAVALIWNALTSGLTTASSIGKLLVDNINATITSRLASSSYTAPPSAAAISTQVASDLATAHGSGSWQTATGFSTLDADGVRSAVGLATANLDTQLAALPTAAEVSTQVAADLAAAHGAGSWATATGFSTLTAADVATELGTGTQFTAIPWNTAWDAEVQSEAADALTAYDPPTNAELEARTLATADYATATNQTTLLNRLGAFTGSGVNTVLGFFKALLSKDATTPSDVGGTFDPATDSTEAIRNRGDAAWGGSGGGGTVGAGAISSTQTLRTTGGTPVAGVDVWVSTDAAGANVVAGTLVTDAFGQVTFLLDAGTYYLWAQLAGYEFDNPQSFTVS